MSGSAASTSPAPRIFVSHSHEDDTFCQRLIRDLRARLGEDAVWYDASGGLHGGDDWWERIVAEITARPFFLVVLSPHADASGWVRQEMGIAFRQHVESGKRLLPVRLAPSFRRPDWAGIHEFDFQAYAEPERYAAALAELLRMLGVDLDARSSAPAARTAAAPASTPQPRQLRPAPAEVRPITLPRERFPERLEVLGFVAQVATDSNSGKEVTFIRSPLCLVPAGPFLMGSDPAQDSQSRPDEQPQHEVTLPAYQIGKFPVTVAEYACFVAAGHAKPVNWSKQQSKLDHPVVRVPWDHARDYAAWLAKLTGQRWALPSEAEWEKAARWDASGNGGLGLSRIYPWGDNFNVSHCNTAELGIKKTTPVGTYGPENPMHDGSSPCGAQDMAGNVSEWTRTIHDNQAYSKKAPREDDNFAEGLQFRVLRGGSWYDDSGRTRAAFRRSLAVLPYNVGDDVGFRIVLLSTS